MQYSTRTADAIHILILITLNESDITSTGLAKSVAAHPAHIRRLMSTLKKAGLLQTCRGKAEPSLTRKPEEISLLEIYKAMEDNQQILHLDTHINPDCGPGIEIQNSLQDCYDRLQAQFEKEMEKITLQDILEGYYRRINKLSIFSQELNNEKITED